MKFKELFVEGIVRSQVLESCLIFGLNDDVIEAKNKEEKIAALKQFVDGELLPRILLNHKIRELEKLTKILYVLANNIGRDVSFSSLGKSVGLNTRSVQRYINILCDEKILFFSSPLFSKCDEEIKTTNKYYFTDLGVRNYFKKDYNSVALRYDQGRLWENFIISERRKLGVKNPKFWRSYSSGHIDYIEEEDKKAYEVRYVLKNDIYESALFKKIYPDFSTDVITPNNFATFLGVESTNIQIPQPATWNDYVI